MINERIQKLRNLMHEYKIDVYYIPTSDFHNSEYVGEHFQDRAYMSGFTGSAGVMFITKQEAILWSDGRYYLQAEKQLANSEIKFMRQGSDGVETPLQYLEKVCKTNQRVAFHGKTVSIDTALDFETVVRRKGATLVYDIDLVSEVWSERPLLGVKPTFVLDEKYTGVSYRSKIIKIRKVMRELEVENHVVTSLDDIAYILNIRGNDIPCTPVVLSYLLIQSNKIRWYVDENKLTDEVKTYLSVNHISVRPYAAIYEDIKHVHDSLLLDSSIVNYTLYKSVTAEVKVVLKQNPSILMKAMKNKIEIENSKQAHIKDGVAVTKFMYWLKNTVGKETLDEVCVGAKMDAFRSEQEGYIEPSFDTICAYKGNAAMMHYQAKVSECASIYPEGMLLVDSGGQYYEGTTDITRTYALGDVDPLCKRDFTLVLNGMSRLSRIHFLYGCSGKNLDILARESLWNMNIDYKSGTGHGVGFVLGVHEGPQRIHWGALQSAVLEEGMIVSNEPGVYVDGKYGIRTENMIVVAKDVKNEYGQFMKFETLTYAPIDLDLIDIAFLDKEAREWLNQYHETVYTKISPYLSEEECAWLTKYTRKI